jgi:hypothetical protein
MCLRYCSLTIKRVVLARLPLSAQYNVPMAKQVEVGRWIVLFKAHFSILKL